MIESFGRTRHNCVGQSYFPVVFLSVCRLIENFGSLVEE
jgi:hypothetical protein